MQLSLSDSLPPSLDPAFATARRFALGDGAWVEYVPEWITGQDQLLRLVRRATDWEQHRRTMYDRVVDVPRLVASAPTPSSGMPASGAFGGGNRADGDRGHLPHTVSDSPALRLSVTRSGLRRSNASPMERGVAERFLEQARLLLSARYDRDLRAVTLACYRHGADSVAWHGDKMGVLRTDTVVAIASVGERRRFLLRPVGGKTCLTFSVGRGDLLVMGGSCQKTWEHSVPKAKTKGPRIAIMFREALPSATNSR